MASILTVDDSATLRQMVAFTLRGRGFDVVEAVDGQDALEVLHGRTFDLVLTDQNMPRMDGLTLVRRLRARPGFERTPILILTTEPADEVRRAGREAGATGWMAKPFDPGRLLEAIARVLP